MSGRTRRLVWRGVDGWRAEACAVEIVAGGLVARGTQIGADPLPYRLDYALDARDGLATRTLDVEVAGDGWSRRLSLARTPGGGWSCRAHEEGEVALPAPGGRADDLGAALDCDLGLSPLTNAPPVLRAGLHARPGSLDLVAAWVSVPDLAVRPSAQRYEHVRPGVVRYVDRGEFAGFRAELELDADGLVRRYPGLAERAA